MLITRVEQLTPAWLTQRLTARGVLRRGAVVGVAVVAHASPAGATADTMSLALTYSDDAAGPVPGRLFLKIAKPDLHPEVLAAGRREVAFYRAMAAATGPVPLPRCYDALDDGRAGHFHLLLDDLSATHFRRPHPIPPSPRHCELLVESLAHLHAYWWESPRLGGELGALDDERLRHERRRRLEATVPAFLDFLGDALLPAQREMYRRVLASPLLSRREARRQRGERITLVHGDVHVGNCLLPHDPARGGVTLIDWQRWEIAVGTDDVACFIARHWSPQRRAALERPLVHRYHRHLTAHGVRGYDWRQCWDDYRGSVALMTLVPIGQFRREQHPAAIWSGLENSSAAYQDLRCAELL